MTDPGFLARLIRSHEWRCLGPHRGGRVVAVAGHPREPMTFFLGACAGGVWKSTDGGTYWECVSDPFFKTASVGAIAVSESDPNVVYAGMGESCIRGDVVHGDGVYRSTDGGRTWKHAGLAETRHIARVRVHPRDPDLVYVAALGHMSAPNEERGVFRSRDGGDTWERVLFRGPNAGAIDLSMDPRNPRVLYAALWEARRTFWELTSGGPGSGIFKSSDGGDTWTELTGNPGLPTGIKGRIGVAVSPARTDRVWAIVEAEEGALFRSDDGGATWERMSDDRALRLRPWYYQHVFADPQDAETVWVLNIAAWRSTDGGKTFTQVSTPHGDNHDLWIDPADPRRMIEGNDGGACVSFNGGVTWSSIYNQPTAQFYHLATDSQFPYRVYGTQQDNSAISVPSRSFPGAIPLHDCYAVGSAESGFIAVRQDDPNTVFAGAIGSAPGGGGVLLRYDHRTATQRIVTVWPEIYGGQGAKDQRYRFQWTFPIVLSPHDQGVLYACGNVVFRSTDEGTSWEAISPDLTRNDESKLGPSGGPVTKDTTGAEHYCTIFAFAESPVTRGLLWAGSDDGLVHVSRDGGRSWEDVTPAGLPEWTCVAMIEASPHDAATAYLAGTRYKIDEDFTPYLFKTHDYGRTWARIDAGIPRDDFTRCIRADPTRRGLLYCGTETGVYLSLDDGASWQSLRLNLPAVPVYDLAVKDDDLIAATHGRSFWVLDDLTALHQAAEAEEAGGAAHLFRSRPAYRLREGPGPGNTPAPGKRYGLAGGLPLAFYETQEPDGSVKRVFLDAGRNPPNGVVVRYLLAEKPEGEVTLTFLDARGIAIKVFSSKPPPDDLAPEQREPVVRAEAGANVFVWNMRYPDATRVPGDITTQNSLAGPLAPPGTYQVVLTAGGETRRGSFEILKDPRARATQEDLDAQFELLIRIRDKLSETNGAVNRLRNLRDQVEEWARRSEGQQTEERLKAAAKELKDKLTAVEEELIQVKAKAAQDTLNFPSKLNQRIAALSAVVSSADAVPTVQSYEVFRDVSSRIDAELRRLAAVVEAEVPGFNGLVEELGLPALIPRT